MAYRHRVHAQGALNLPEWLQSHQYKDPIGSFPTAFSSAVHTDLKPFEWLAANPWAWKLAQVHMKVQREGRPTFFDAMDFSQRFAQDSDHSTILLVDIGGGTGSQARTLRQRFPDLPGRIIAQDRPEVIANVKDDLTKANIEAEVYDLFKPQPIKGMLPSANA